MAKVAKYNGIPGCVDPRVLILYQDTSIDAVNLTLPSDTTMVRVTIDGIDIRFEDIKAVQTNYGWQDAWDAFEEDIIRYPYEPSDYSSWLYGRYPIRYLRQETEARGDLGGFQTDAIFLVGEAYQDWYTNEIVVNEFEYKLPTESKQVLPSEPVDGTIRLFWSWPEFRLSWTDEIIIPDGNEFNPEGSPTKTISIEYFDSNVWVNVTSFTITKETQSISVECSDCEAHCIPMYDANIEDFICLCKDEPGKPSSEPRPNARKSKPRPPVKLNPPPPPVPPPPVPPPPVPPPPEDDWIEETRSRLDSSIGNLFSFHVLVQIKRKVRRNEAGELLESKLIEARAMQVTLISPMPPAQLEAYKYPMVISSLNTMYAAFGATFNNVQLNFSLSNGEWVSELDVLIKKYN